VVGNLILVLLEIYCSLQQRKKFANTPRNDKVIAMVRVAPFLIHGVVLNKMFLQQVGVNSSRIRATDCTTVIL